MPLTPKAFDTLVLLLEADGRLVTKEELMEALWPGTFVSESNLTQTVFLVRKALGETGDQRYVVTVTGRGYRFSESLKRSVVPAATAAADPVTAASRTRWPIVAAASLALIVAAAGFVWRSFTTPANEPSNGRLMLAVLPFENLTGDPGEEYLCDGMTEEMIAQVGRLNPARLGVIARTSVMRYKDGAANLGEIGRALGVQYVLEGSVRRDSDRLRITAQLIAVKDLTTLWSQQYDRPRTNLLTVQSEIAQQIANEIQIQLGTRQTRATDLSARDYEVYDLYLQGRYYWNKRSTEGFKQAVQFFEAAIAKDPNYSRAYAGLADAYALIASYGIARPSEVVPKARAAAERAIQLDESLAEAHTSLALITENHDWDWATAERQFQRAIELNPNYSTARHWYAEYLGFQGRFDEALAEIERARKLDPLSLIIAADRGAILYFARQYDQAIEQFRAVLEIEPTFSRATLIIPAYAAKGQFDEALESIEKRRRWHEDPWPWAWAANVHARAGRPEEALRAFTKMQELNRRDKQAPVPLLTTAYAGMGRRDEFFALLENAVRERSSLVVTLKVDPVYDVLRGDPRFAELLRRVRLAP